MDQSREWLEHMLDTQGTGTGLTASASVTAYQQLDLTLSHKKSSPSIDPRKTPTPASQESKRSSSQPKEGEPPSVAALTEKPSPNPYGASLGKPSQGRSQSSGVAPSWKTPSVSSIPTQLSEDPAELAAINSGINKMGKQASMDEAEMETTDSGLEDLRAPGSLRRSSSSASERLKERRASSFREPSSTIAVKGSDASVIVLEDNKEEEVKKKDRRRKQLSSGSFSTQLSSKGTSFSTQGSEFIAEVDDDEDEDHVSEKADHTSTDGGRERRVSPRGRRSEGMTLSRLVEWGVLPVNATLRLGEHGAVLLKNGWLDYGDHDPAPSLLAWAEAVLPRKTKIDEADLWSIITEDKTGLSLAELDGQRPRPAKDALLAAMREEKKEMPKEKEEKAGKKEKKETKEKEMDDLKSKEVTKAREQERSDKPLKQRSVTEFTTASSPQRVLPSWAGDGAKKKGGKVEAIAASLKAKQQSGPAARTESKKKADAEKEKSEKKEKEDKKKGKGDKKKADDKRAADEEANESANKLKRRVKMDAAPAPSLGSEEELLEVAADRTPKKKPKKDNEKEKEAKNVTPPKDDKGPSEARTPTAKEKECGSFVRTPAAKDTKKEKEDVVMQDAEKEKEKRDKDRKSSGDEQKKFTKKSRVSDEAKAPAKERVILGTGLSSARQEQLAALAKALGGGRIAREFTAEVTHVVTPLTKGDGLANRTLKYLMGILRGCWIVSFEWAEACYDQQTWVSEQEYEVKGDSYGVGGPTASRTAHAQRLPPLFHEMQFYFHGEFGTPSKARSLMQCF